MAESAGTLLPLLHGSNMSYSSCTSNFCPNHQRYEEIDGNEDTCVMIQADFLSAMVPVSVSVRLPFFSLANLPTSIWVTA